MGRKGGVEEEGNLKTGYDTQKTPSAQAGAFFYALTAFRIAMRLLFIFSICGVPSRSTEVLSTVTVPE